MRIYLAGSISGKNYDESFAAFDETAKKLADWGFEVIHPMQGKEHLKANAPNNLPLRPEGYTDPVSNNHSILNKDYWSVQYSDIVLVDLSTTNRVSIGSCFEIAWAWASKLLVIVVLPEGENVHRHGFILEAATSIFPTMDEAIKYLISIRPVPTFF